MYEYEQLLEKQAGVCKICNKPETRKTKNSDIAPLVIDHDHATNKVRGLLCYKCNAGLGMFLDNINNLKAAIEYLQEASNERYILAV